MDSDENFRSDSDDKMASLTNPEQSKQEQLAIDSGVLSFNGHPGTKFPAGLKVLAVDDDALCLRCLEALLKRCNYEVVTCSTAQAALSYLRSNECDIVLSDVHMPNMGGFNLLEIIGLEMDMPVIMVSANSDASVVLEGITHGAVDYLLKPVRIAELRNIWQHVVRKKFHTIDEDDDKKKKRKEDFADDVSTEEGSDPSAPKKTKTEWSEDDHQEFVEGVTRLATEKAVPQRILDLLGVTDLTREKIASRLQDDMGESDSLSMPKKPRVMWSVELHQSFVNAVNDLGIDKAVPKRILDLMGVSGLTRENVASHLQKYRLYLKRINGVRKSKNKNVGNPFLGDMALFESLADPSGSNHRQMFEQQHNVQGVHEYNSDCNQGGYSNSMMMQMPLTMGSADLRLQGLVNSCNAVNPKLQPGLYDNMHGNVPHDPAAKDKDDHLVVSMEFPADALHAYPNMHQSQGQGGRGFLPDPRADSNYY